jgi:hypothetical protein
LLLVGGTASTIGPALRLVGGANAVGQALRLLMLVVGLLQDLWLFSWLVALALASSDGDAPRFILLVMRRHCTSSQT